MSSAGNESLHLVMLELNDFDKSSLTTILTLILCFRCIELVQNIHELNVDFQYICGCKRRRNVLIEMK